MEVKFRMTCVVPIKKIFLVAWMDFLFGSIKTLLHARTWRDLAENVSIYPFFNINAYGIIWVHYVILWLAYLRVYYLIWLATIEPWHICSTWWLSSIAEIVSWWRKYKNIESVSISVWSFVVLLYPVELCS